MGRIGVVLVEGVRALTKEENVRHHTGQRPRPRTKFVQRVQNEPDPLRPVASVDFIPKSLISMFRRSVFVLLLPWYAASP